MVIVNFIVKYSMGNLNSAFKEDVNKWHIY